ncbi:uncharacterized protein LOC116416688 [Nasonia vitripennis]|uniref:Uncharacterized protein n=1 Tax=Nasonia vitripennis TaxID=7425 RepID=A0A7M7Q708_NASVI|nr:uncharacterized protein LOC116416688 [Nasonia vitripennis]XP_031781749.1 uncharacterized protein LOC116416688 [Nasonia vitripennis]
MSLSCGESTESTVEEEVKSSQSSKLSTKKGNIINSSNVIQKYKKSILLQTRKELCLDDANDGDKSTDEGVIKKRRLSEMCENISFGASGDYTKLVTDNEPRVVLRNIGFNTMSTQNNLISSGPSSLPLKLSSQRSSQTDTFSKISCSSPSLPAIKPTVKSQSSFSLTRKGTQPELTDFDDFHICCRT